MDSKLLRFTCLLIFICWVNLTKSVDGSPPAKNSGCLAWCKSTKPAENTVKSFEKYGAKVKSIQIGTEEHELDIALHMRMDKQVMNVCRQLTNDPELKNGFALIGHSLGGTAVRGLVQMCPELSITDVISMCGPQQGIFGIPNCQIIEGIFTGICDKLDTFQEAAVSIAPVLDTLSIFTPIMNVIGNNATLLALWVDPNSCAPPTNNFVNLINSRLATKFPKENLSGDTFMKPKESPMFGWFKDGSETEVIPYNETDLYTQDYIGLKELDEQGRFFTVEWFEKEIIERFYDV